MPETLLKTLSAWLEAFRTSLQIPLLRTENFNFTLWSLAVLVLLTVVLFVGTRLFANLVVRRLLKRTSLDMGVQDATASIIRYVLVVIGALAIVQTAGIDLTTLNVLAGAVGIGVGFGLQNVANNFISGIIILFERPIKVGDRVEVEKVDGTVVRIGLRSTTVITNDDISIIIPNSKFISETVTNWSHSDSKVRRGIKVGVHYDSDVEVVRAALMDAAADCPDVLEHPEPRALLLEFGDSSLNFELRVWTQSLLHQPGLLTDVVNTEIYRKFRERGIQIPYPQRVLHQASSGPTDD